MSESAVVIAGVGLLTIPQMCKAGSWFNLLGVAIVTAVTYLLVVPMLVRQG